MATENDAIAAVIAAGKEHDAHCVVESMRGRYDETRQHTQRGRMSGAPGTRSTVHPLKGAK